jgi:hypothetical protein
MGLGFEETEEKSGGTTMHRGAAGPTGVGSHAARERFILILHKDGLVEAERAHHGPIWYVLSLFFFPFFFQLTAFYENI